MILPLHEQVRARVRAVLAQLHGITDPDLVIPIEYPPNRTLGDLGTPVAFDLARRLRKAPRVIAQELAAALGPIPGIARVEAAPNGYLNVFLDRPAFLLSRLGLAGELPAASARTPRRPSSSTPRSTQQGRAHRASPEFRARRHARAGAQVPRQPRRSAELHRRHRRAGGRRRGGISRAREADRSTMRGASRRPRDSITTAGTCTRASPSGTRATRSG